MIKEKRANGQEIYTCIICEMKFESNSEFKIHLKSHTSTKDDVEHYELELREENSAATSASSLSTGTVFYVDDSSASLPSRAKKLQCQKCFKCFSLKYVKNRILFVVNVLK